MNASFEALARPEIRSLTPYASARALADSAGILLNANENPFPSPGDPGLGLNRYPDPQPTALLDRLADLYRVARERLLVTRGSDEGIDLLVRTFCAPGEAVLTVPPCFGMYALSARVQGARVIEAPLVEHADRFEAPDDLVERARDCKLAFLCSPNNPTGNVLTEATVREVGRALDGRGLVVVDEAYVEFQHGDSFTTLLDELPNLVVLRTLSKAHALAGCRLGTVIADPAVIGLLKRIIAPYPLPTPTVEAALAALTPEALATQARRIAEIDQQKQRLVEALRSLDSIRAMWPGEANFVLVRVADAARLIDDAAAAGIRLRNQSAQPGLDHCVRITVGAPDENRALIAFLETWTP
ncbi:histidinol-phosphate transaminase [Wenzhouxiangella sp. XN79A]|uniref:histidinol-phosphate transaminase n=1 Tax=Wenzhouxiangella sp. XN79A TaxID=2724193 RepID=UPI00144AEDEF|nr:histidinol-phosphate transaminase [Wenzhouxiangella sp. XN79A]NKI33874.1 histidinol-phosphate transaminase [Wenzhouxiangella sp. XN79A]